MAELTADQQAREALEALMLSIPRPVMEALEQTYLYRNNFVVGDTFATALMLGEAKLVLDLRQIRLQGEARRQRE